MTREERDLITQPVDAFTQIAKEYDDMTLKCIEDIKTTLTSYFPHEDPRLIKAITMIIADRYLDDVTVLVEKIKNAVEKIAADRMW